MFDSRVNSHSDDCNCEHNLLQRAGHTKCQRLGRCFGVGIACAQGCVDRAGTLVDTLAGEDGDGDHRAREAHVQGHA